jgi:hypothetical protein
VLKGFDMPHPEKAGALLLRVSGPDDMPV